MNPLEIYKLLPKTNCGECGSKTCMPFAVSLGGDPGRLEQCRHIETSKREAIKSMLVQGDWRDGLVRSLMENVSVINLSEVASGLGCIMKGGRIAIRCVGQEYEIGSAGTITPDTGNKWVKILLLHYVRNRGKGEFSGRWVSFSELKGGFVKVASFRRDCEKPLRQLMDEDPGSVAAVIARLGASEVAGVSADYAWSLDLLPKVRTLILYRPGDEEFPSSLSMLFDAVTPEFIDVESLIFLCEGLVHTLTNMRR